MKYLHKWLKLPGALARWKRTYGLLGQLWLKEIYESHKDYVCDLMCDVLVYSDRMAKELFDDFTIKVDINGQKVPIKLFDNEEQIKEMVFGQPLKEEELHKRPLAKLTYDLLEDLLPKKKVNSKQ